MSVPIGRRPKERETGGVAATLVRPQSTDPPSTDERERADTMSRTNSPTVLRVTRGLRSAGSRWDLVRTALAWLGTVVVAAAVAVAAVGSRKVGLALAGLVLVFGIFDLLVFIGALVALFHVRWNDAYYLRRFMRGIVWYQAILLLVVVFHPFRDDIVEWFHRWSYIGGSVLVGWVIATHGRTRQAFRLFLAGSSILAVIAMEHAVTLHFQPAQWGVYQKNGIGAVMWVAVVIAQINPPWTGLGRWEARINKLLCIGGLLASQSRQSIILLILALALAAFLNPELRARSRMMMLAALPVVVALYYSFEINARVNPKFNSVSTRVGQISAALHVWHLSPILGEGMRFYNLPQFSSISAAPNVLVDNLASTGIVGSLAFLFLVAVTVRTMFRLPYALGTLGLVILVFHYVDGMFDIFWIGASSIAPFIIAGVSLGMADLDRRDRTAVPGTSAPTDQPVGAGRDGPEWVAGARRSLRAGGQGLARSTRAALGLLPSP